MVEDAYAETLTKIQDVPETTVISTLVKEHVDYLAMRRLIEFKNYRAGTAEANIAMEIKMQLDGLDFSKGPLEIKLDLNKPERCKALMEIMSAGEWVINSRDIVYAMELYGKAKLLDDFLSKVRR